MFDATKVRLAIAPIAWTNDDLPDLGAENTFEQCISEMALSGFSGSEIGNKYPKDAERLRHMLAIRGLQICNAWFSSTLLSEGYEATIKALIKHRDFLHELGARVIGASEQQHPGKAGEHLRRETGLHRGGMGAHCARFQ